MIRPPPAPPSDGSPADSGFTLRHLRKINNYAVRAKLGVGSSCVVYLGVDVRTNERYAIKRIRMRELARNGDAVSQLEREVRLMREFDHPNLLKLVEVLHHPAACEVYLILEYADKGCLAEFVRRNQPIPRQSLLSIIKQIASAVRCLHETGHVHQDIKPGNILLDGRGRAILADFGIGHTFKTASTVVGSPAYQAPEVLSDSDDEDPPEQVPQLEDVWSLGVTFYQLLFLKLPFVGENLYEVVKDIKGRPLAIPDGTDPEIEGLLRAMLAVNPAERIGVDELCNNPLISAAPDRAPDIPPVPTLRLRDGDFTEIQADVVQMGTVSFADFVTVAPRRFTFQTGYSRGRARGRGGRSRVILPGEV
jgi:serine/threonine-protein kinase 11